MSRAIREHLRDFIAIAVLLVLAVVTTGIILVQQSANFPSWVPILGSDHFELKAEFTTAQAVTPGQGQQITIAGIKVGTVGGVKLENGAAVVTMDIDNKYARLIHPDATLLLRPRTGLQDMTIEVDPGTDKSEVKEGSTIPLAQTQPNVQPDQIFASLDADTRSYLQLLLQAAGQGLRGQNGPKLAASFKRFAPTARDLAKIGGALETRRQNLRRVITNFGKISQQLGHSDTQLAGFVRSSNDVLGSFAHQEAAIRQTLQELPATLKTTRASLESGDRFAQQLGPASRRLIPAAQAFGPAMREIRPLFRQTTGPIHHQIRPFARAVRKPLGQLKKAANPLTRTSTNLASAFKNLNLGLNALAYNPPGSAQEGYLFWLGWLNHDTNALFFTQDAGGPLRHGIVMDTCSLAAAAEFAGSLDANILTLLQLSGVPLTNQIHAAQPGCTPNPGFPPPFG
jgi:phospholipid/cholesterol/gamma-HCH transport system substrate-binding protein